jgi:thiol:disulfide interchange protein
MVMKSVRLFVILMGLLVAAGAAYSSGRILYPNPAQAKPQIEAALKMAAREHKRVLLDFGGNWCGDCQVLDIYFHNAENLPILEKNYVLVHVNVGQYDANLDLAKKYGIPLEKGVPAIAVLSDTGKLLYSQRGGEFEKMGRMEPGDVKSFLVQWKPAKAGCSVVAVNC